MSATIYLFRYAGDEHPLLVRVVGKRTFVASPTCEGWNEVPEFDDSISNDFVILPPARAIELMEDWCIEPDGLDALRFGGEDR